MTLYLETRTMPDHRQIPLPDDALTGIFSFLCRGEQRRHCLLNRQVAEAMIPKLNEKHRWVR